MSTEVGCDDTNTNNKGEVKKVNSKTVLMSLILALLLTSATGPTISSVSNSQPTQPQQIVEIRSVDISGNGAYIAVGYGTKVSLFNSIAPPHEPVWSDDTGFQVAAVALSEDGNYLAVVSNEDFRSWLFLYRSTNGEQMLHEPLFETVSISKKGLDISRDGRYIAVVTNTWTGPYCEHTGLEYVFENPDFGIGLWVTTVDYCPLAVRFSGDGQYFTVGAYWYELRVYEVPLILRASTSTGRVNYGLAISYHAERIVVGDGFSNIIQLYEFVPATNQLIWLWKSDRTITDGSQGRIAISDDYSYIAVSQYQNYPDEINGFHLFDSSIPLDPNNKQPIWTYITMDPAVRVDMSVWNSMYVVGGSGNFVYQWGDGHPTYPSIQPEHETPVAGVVSEVAISYGGSVYTAGTNDGYLYVYVAGVVGYNEIWSWHTL